MLGNANKNVEICLMFSSYEIKKDQENAFELIEAKRSRFLKAIYISRIKG